MRTRVVVGSAMLLALNGGCSADRGGPLPAPASDDEGAGAVSVGQLHVALASPRTAVDVQQVLFTLVRADQRCGEAPLQSSMESLILGAFEPPGAGVRSSAAASLFVVEAGQYRVCASPLGAQGQPSADCATGETVHRCRG
jgi:hypothetical protein